LAQRDPGLGRLFEKYRARPRRRYGEGSVWPRAQTELGWTGVGGQNKVRAMRSTLQMSLTLFLGVMLTSCVSPYQEVGALEIQIKAQGAEGDRFVNVGEFGFTTSVSTGRNILSNLKRITGQKNTFLIEETVSAGDLRGDHTDYLLLYSTLQRGSGRPHPQVIPIDVGSKKPRGVWSAWIAPEYSEQSGDSEWNLLYRTKATRLVPLEETPLAKIRYRLVASSP